MVFIEGGEFLMGSPPEEPDRDADEGSQHQVRVGDFWMGKYEVNWIQYSAFWRDVRENYDSNIDGEKKERDLELHELISAPSQMWVPDGGSLDLGMGFSDEYPAVRMTQFGAKKFCQWLSAQAVHFYRLTTEVEWGYACRAGSTGLYSCDEVELADFAILDPDQTRVTYAKIGTKKPNPWGLYDMHGNVFEWVCDRYYPDLYQKRFDTGGRFTDPVVWPSERFPRVMRGGS
jgi:formylglycine-generating enzyme required for sulfatase activity